jgi:protoporphyrinogen/coproporphyrinogen III oxidase
VRVLVIGGGITGLTAAYVLGRAGVPVTLLEAGPRLGGKIATERADGFLIEHGPDSFLTARPAALDLAMELGLGSELIGTSEPRTVWVLHRGRLVRMPEGLGLVLPTKVRPFATTPLFSPLEKARMAADLVRPRLLGSDDVAVGAYLRRRLGNALVDRLAGPLVGGIYGTPIDELSLDAVMPQLRASERDHRSLLLAGLAQGRAAQQARTTEGPPGRPPVNGAATGMFASLRGGMGCLVESLELALARMSGTVEVRTGVAVEALRREREATRAALSDGTSLRAEAVVLATPAPVAASLLKASLPAAAAALAAIPHGSSITVTLGYREEQVGAPVDGHGFLVPSGEGSIMACTWSSRKWSGRAPEGAILLRAFFPDLPHLRRVDEETVLAMARADVEKILRTSGEPLLSRVLRTEGAMPRYTVGHLGRVAAAEAAVAEWPGLVVAGAAYRGVGLPDCVLQGRAAAAAVVRRLAGYAARGSEAAPA